MTHGDIKSIRVQAYNAAFRAAKSDGIVTSEEESELKKLQDFFKIPESEILTSKKELAKLRILTEIQNGNPPFMSVSNVVLQKNETIYWSEPSSLLEERVVGRRYEGGSQGLSIRITSGVTYRVGAHRGRIISDTAIVPVSSGELIITNKRIIFRGDAKSFNLRLDKLLELNLYGNGIRLTDDKGKSCIVKFTSEGNSDIVGATLSFAINQF
jgi:hypothetical protein